MLLISLYTKFVVMFALLKYSLEKLTQKLKKEEFLLLRSNKKPLSLSKLSSKTWIFYTHKYKSQTHQGTI